MPLGLFLLFSIFLVVTCPRPPVFARPNILVASFATQAIVASFATQARACILSDHNIFYTPREGGNGGVMPLGLFLFILFHQKYPFGKLFSKIIINSPSAFWFFQKLEKFKIRLEAPLRPPETRENCAFLASSYAIMEIVPVLPFGS